MQHVKVAETNFMGDANASSGGRAIHPMLLPFPIACFAGALVTDLAYWQTADMMWETFSVWLVTVGLIMAGLAIIAFVIDLIGRKPIRTLAWPHAVGYPLALLLSLINVFVHSRDGYTAVVPTGLTLSAVVVVILLFTGWVGSALVHRHRVGGTI
jgi:uncharacterized membrane protein